MIKIVQVEERRCICDICGDKHYTMHGARDTKREGWVHADNFATTGKTLDICPVCADFLKSFLDTAYTGSFMTKCMNEPCDDPSQWKAR